MSTKYDIKYKNKIIPPKYTIDLANKFANGRMLTCYGFYGGKESNSFLRSRDFVVEPKSYVRS